LQKNNNKKNKLETLFNISSYDVVLLM